MRIIIALGLVLLSQQSVASSDVVLLIESLLGSENRAASLGKYYSSDKVELYNGIISQLGEIDEFICAQNHDSEVFDTVACYTTFENSSMALTWEFYLFDDDGKWQGTNLGVIQEIEDSDCIKDIKFGGALGKGITYDSNDCK